VLTQEFFRKLAVGLGFENSLIKMKKRYANRVHLVIKLFTHLGSIEVS
jgi:hypothetical protein